jgi:hypothetical protein
LRYFLRYPRSLSNRVRVERSSLYDKLILQQAFGEWVTRSTTYEIVDGTPDLIVDFRFDPRYGINRKVLYTGNGNIEFTKEIEHTDFPLNEITPYFANNVIHLPSEY